MTTWKILPLLCLLRTSLALAVFKRLEATPDDLPDYYKNSMSVISHVTAEEFFGQNDSKNLKSEIVKASQKLQTVTTLVTGKSTRTENPLPATEEEYHERERSFDFRSVVQLIPNLDISREIIDDPFGGKNMKASNDLPVLDYPYSKALDEFGSFVLLWLPEDEEITFEVQVETQGYIGLGFSKNGGMEGADVVIGWVDEAGILHFQDRYASMEATPSVDVLQDYKLLGGYQNKTHTVVRFSRPWKTCDLENDIDLYRDWTTRVIWCFDPKDPEDTTYFQRHAFRGSVSLSLISPQQPSDRPIGKDDLYWDVTAGNVSIPEGTHYLCKIIKMPDMKRKSHLIGYELNFQRGHGHLIHHILFMECHLPNSSYFFEKYADSNGFTCFGHDLPKEWMSCNTLLISWSIGSTGMIYPDHVGIPLGEDYGGATYFMLEIHYQNYNSKKGVIDDSGLRLTYTYDLRKYDAGMLKVGMQPSPALVIPPGQEWYAEGHCSHECLDKTISNEGIRIFQGYFHAHETAKSVSLIQIRNGSQLPVLYEEKYYDYKYQQSRTLRKEVEILPGDDVLLRCRFDSRKKRETTFGGLRTDDEMCLTHVVYYPKMNMSSCYSKPRIQMVLHAIGINELMDEELDDRIEAADEKFNLFNTLDMMDNQEEIKLRDIYSSMIVKSPAKYTNISVYDILTSEGTWRDRSLLSRLQYLTLYGDQAPVCKKVGYLPIEELPEMIRYPQFIPFEEPKVQCSSSVFKDPVATGRTG